MYKGNLVNLFKKSLCLVFIILFTSLMQSCEDDATGNDELVAPSNLSVVDDNPSNFRISWTDNSNDETGFSIERKKDSGSFTEITTVNADVTEYTDTITESGTFSYRVRAIKGTEYSDYSNTVNETIDAPTEHTTDITSNETWISGIHFIEGYVYVKNGAILTIQAGAVIKFAENAAMIVQTNSGLIADGTTGAITFTGQAAQNGYWRYIQFDDDALDASCKLINCTIEYGGGYNNQSAQLIIENEATVNNCTIRNSSSNGVEIVATARPTFTNNTITLNNASPIIAGFTSAASIGTGMYSGNTNDFIDLDNGTINENGTFLKQDVPYRLNNYNYIESVTLTIEAGASFLMNSESALLVSTNGGLMAIGTETDSIHFTGYAEQKGHWRFIRFEDDAIDANCNLDYCIIEYGGGDGNRANLTILNDATITNSNIRNSESHGVEIYSDARPTFDNNTVTLNDISPIYGSFESMTSIGYGDYDGNTNDFIDLVSGTIAETGTLKKQNVPYRFNNYSYIDNATLTIESGVTIQMNSDAALIVSENGGLIADGTGETITFTGYAASNGYWRFIRFASDAIPVNCQLLNCVLEYGGGNGATSGIIDIQNVPTVTGNTIRHSSSYGITYDIDAGSHGDYLSDNTFSDNTAGSVHGY